MSLNRPSSRSRPARSRAIPLAALVALACVRQQPDDPNNPEPPSTEADLLALLNDGDLTAVLKSAQMGIDGGPPDVRPADASPIDGPRGGGGTGGFGGMGTGGFAGGFGGSGGTFPIPRDAGPPVPFCPRGGGFAGAGGGFGFDAGGGPTNAFCPPLARWEMDDCNMGRTELRDQSGNGFTAYRSVGVVCVPGIEGSAVALPNPRDIVFVPDQPAFSLAGGVTVAAFVNPFETTGVRSLIRKRDGKTSSFVLLVNNRRFQFVISRTGASPVTVSAPAELDKFSHVAASYDNQDLRLFVDGQQVAVTRAPGVILGGEGPVLVGNDADGRKFEGTVDRVIFDTKALAPQLIAAETCVRNTPTLRITPAVGPPTPPETPVIFNVELTNTNGPTCLPEQFFLNQDFFTEQLQIQPSFTQVTVSSGQTARVPVTVTASSEAEAGEHVFGFSAFRSMGIQRTPVRAQATFVVSDLGCRVRTPRELFIRDVSVVDDPVRTGFGAPADDPRRGVWTFKHLIEQMAPTPADAPRMVEQMFRSFTTPQTVNGFTISTREGMLPTVLDPWPRTTDGALDLARAPLRLLGIVNRIDLRTMARGPHAGEGRFVFGVQGPPEDFAPEGFPLEFTVILEYKLPATTEAEIQKWADDWHALGSLPFPSEQYNAALQELTSRFTRRGAAPDRPNGSSLGQLRTNEIALSSVWQLREFTISPTTGLFQPDTIKLTPDQRFDGSPTLGEFINQNEMALITQTHDVPLQFVGAPFLGGAVFNNLTGWFAPGVRNNEARHGFSVNTCNGCHSSQETGVGFLQVGNRFRGEEAFLSGFLTGTTVSDPGSGQLRTFNDLGRRNRDLRLLVCPPGTVPPLPPTPPPMMGPPRPPMGPRDAGVAPVGGAGGTGGATGGGAANRAAATPAPLAPGQMVPPPVWPETTLREGIKRVH